MSIRTGLVLVVFGISTLASAALTPEEDKQLRADYLVCDQATEEGMLGANEAAVCSIIYEKLLKEVFAGDFKAFMAWWQTTRKPAAEQQAPASN